MGRLEETKNIMENVAWSFHGLPYIWGGDDPMKGFDCSGFVIEILKSVALLPRKGDWTAQGLYNRFLITHQTQAEPEFGCLAFWHSPWGEETDKIVHVEFCLNDFLTMGASGGGSKTKTEEDASAQNAYIKVRPIRQTNLKTIINVLKRLE
ncbi:MAG: hypothetical protein DRJ03_00935 [Chloroflexi bacterium]|nr:MAG: hypothetical protein DRJ03_00935 [Chloroflexota bacterium]